MFDSTGHLFAGGVDPWSELGRDGSREMESLARARVIDAEFPGMEHQPTRLHGLSGDRGVNRIADQRCALVLHVHADLVSASGVQVAQHESGAGLRIRKQHFIIRDRGSARGRGDDRHFLSIARIASDVGKDCFARRLGCLLSDAEVDFLIRAVGKLAGEVLVRAIIFRHDETAGSILIQSMDNAGAFHATDPGKLALAVVEQGIDQRAIGISRSGVNDNARLLIQHDEVLVLKQYLQGDILWGGLGRDRFRQGDLDDIAHLHRIARLGGFAIAEDVLFPDQFLDARARQVCQPTGEPCIQAVMVGDVDG